jgi:Methylamine utilization protein MauJ
LHRSFFDSIQVLLQAKPPDYVVYALRLFRQGVLERQPEDQFQHFWLAIETTAEGSKEIARIPIPCPNCSGDLFCAKCNTTPTRRPMARQAIKQLLSKIHGSSDQLYQMLVRTRDHLLHGRSPDLVEAKIGVPMEALVDMAGATAWNAIWHSMPHPESQITLMDRGGKFANRTLVVDSVMEFAYPGDAAHPTEDQIPKVELSMSTKFV